MDEPRRTREFGEPRRKEGHELEPEQGLRARQHHPRFLFEVLDHLVERLLDPLRGVGRLHAELHCKAGAQR